MSSRSAEERIEERIENLPLLDMAVTEILALLNSLDSNFEQIVQRLSPEMAAKFLNMANSAYYGVEVRTVDFAVRVLGYSGMKQVLLTSELLDHFSKCGGTDPFRFERYLREARFCACVSRVLGRMLGYRDPAELFTVSMLHNIGELVIAVYFQDEHRRIAQGGASGSGAGVETERHVLGFHHAEIGAITLKTFGLSDDILDAVRYHHEEGRMPPENTNYPMELIVRASAGLLERTPLPRGMDFSEMEEPLMDRIGTGMGGGPVAGMPWGDIYEGVEICRTAVHQAEELLFPELASLFAPGEVGEMPASAG